MNIDVLKALNDDVDVTRLAALEAVLSLHPVTRQTIIDYVEAQQSLELALCGTQDDITKLRQSQGAVRAFATVQQLLTHEPVEKRRTTSRQEV